jgi:hypothetical protein
MLSEDGVTPVTPAALLALQRTAGNAAVSAGLARTRPGWPGGQRERSDGAAGADGAAADALNDVRGP